MVSISTISLDYGNRQQHFPRNEPLNFPRTELQNIGDQKSDIFSQEKRYYCDNTFSNDKQSVEFKQDEDFDSIEIMENFDPVEDNLEETKKLMNSFDKRNYNHDENNFALSHSEYIKRKLNFDQNQQDPMMTQKVNNFNNIFRGVQNDLENEYFSM